MTKQQAESFSDMLKTLQHTRYFLRLMSYTLECQETAEALIAACDPVIRKAEAVEASANAPSKKST